MNTHSDHRELSFVETVIWAAVIGMGGGAMAIAYHFLLESSQFLIWDQLSKSFTPEYPQQFLLAVTSMGGLLVGISLKVFGAPGEMAKVIADVHNPGKIDIQQTPSMVIASLISITAGGSAGPEAPLVQINASLGSWLGDMLGISAGSVRKLTFCGMSAALGAFFGAPLGGALFALEIPHRQGLEYYEALIPATVSAFMSFAVFESITGTTIGGIYKFAPVTEITLLNLVMGLLLGLVGGLVALLFILLFRLIGYLVHPFSQFPVALATFGGFGIGAIALVYPQTLFFGETQIETMIETGSSLEPSMLLAIALAKMIAISITLHCGFRGGFIFPLFFIGATVGVAISAIFPQIPITIAMVCMMAAVNVAVTKTPISSTVILTVISDTSMVPVILAASLVSFMLTSSVSLLNTQRSRQTVDNLLTGSITA